MSVCAYCKAYTTNFLLCRRSAVQRLFTASRLDVTGLSEDENAICRSHLEYTAVDPKPHSEASDVNQSSSPVAEAAVGGCAEDEPLPQLLSTMLNVREKEEVLSVPESGDAVQSSSTQGRPESRIQTNALPMQPTTPTQVCDVTSTSPSSDSEVQECPVCLQPPQLPIKLPCNHIFCFLCAKGVANQLGRCAYCRADIPEGYMNLPTVVPRNPEENPTHDSKYFWYYAGRDGWWQFEERHCIELEEALTRGDAQYELQVSGFMYVIDLQQMLQYRKDRPGRTRRIKRDTVTAPRKGVAGLREDLINPGSFI